MSALRNAVSLFVNCAARKDTRIIARNKVI